MLITDIGVAARKFLEMPRIFARIFPNMPEKLKVVPTTFAYKFSFTKIMKTFLWCDLCKNGLHLFFCKRWAPFFEVKQGWAPVLLGFSGILPRCLGILSGFSGIWPGFSRNQNFSGCACTPSPTPLIIETRYLTSDNRTMA